VQRPYKRLDIRTANRLVCSVALCLDINSIKTQGILPYDAVQTLITYSSEVLSRTRSAAVTHRGEKAQHELLEECRLARANAV